MMRGGIQSERTNGTHRKHLQNGVVSRQGKKYWLVGGGGGGSAFRGDLPEKQENSHEGVKAIGFGCGRLTKKGRAERIYGNEPEKQKNPGNPWSMGTTEQRKNHLWGTAGQG